jgi:protein-S-isoprenylcysteine O-methyltransferase Ste14
MNKILEKQGWQGLTAGLLAAGVWIAARGIDLSGNAMGLSTGTWLVLGVLLPVVHQFYVVLLWRSELYYSWLSRALGKKAFTVWAIGFMILFLTRPITILALGIADQGSLPIPSWLNIPLIATCTLICLYMAYSFVKYFGVKRALGMDHFQPDRYRELPFVRQGIFKWSPNAMYTFAFLGLWLIGLAFQSRAALLGALFNHLYIWAHYYFTELPDMRAIYGPN